MNAETFDGLRADVYDRAVAITEDTEVEELLDNIVQLAADDLGSEFGDPEDYTLDNAEDLLASVEAWAALASHVTLEAYAGPVREVGAMHRRLAGWTKGVGATLTKMTGLLARYLAAAKRALGALTYSIGVSFPFGVSVSLSW